MQMSAGEVLSDEDFLDNSDTDRGTRQPQLQPPNLQPSILSPGRQARSFRECLEVLAKTL